MYYQDEPDIYCVHAIKVDLIYIYIPYMYYQGGHEIYCVCTIKVDLIYTLYILSRWT